MASELGEYIGNGNGHDGDKVISGTENINSYASITASASSTTVTSGLSVNAGDLVLLIQTQGANHGRGEYRVVDTPGAGSFTVDRYVTNAYISGAQAILVPQYTSLTITGTLQPTAWGGSSGGYAIAFCTGKISGAGTINLKGRGFRKGTADTGAGQQGESNLSTGSDLTAANEDGGGGGSKGTGGAPQEGGGGAGGGNSVAGSVGHTFTGSAAAGGLIAGNAALTDFDLPGAGGAGGADGQSRSGQNNHGGNGAANFMFVANEIDFSDMTSINGLGNDGGAANAGVSFAGGGGAGAGASGILRASIINYGTNKINLSGGTHGEGTNQTGGTNDGGDGADGRLRAEGCTVSGSALNASVSESEGGHVWCGSVATIIE